MIIGCERLVSFLLTLHAIYEDMKGFSGGSEVKNPPDNAGESGWIPGLGRSIRGGNGNSLQHSFLGNPMETEKPGGLQFVGSQRVGHALVTKQQQHEDVNYIKVCSVDDLENVDGISGEKEDSRTNRFKKEDCVLGFGPTGLEIIVMNQLCWWISR